MLVNIGVSVQHFDIFCTICPHGSMVEQRFCSKEQLYTEMYIENGIETGKPKSKDMAIPC